MLWFSDSWVRWPKFLQRFNSLIPKIAKLQVPVPATEVNATNPEYLRSTY
jgi:hypothetical protein